MNRCSGCGVLLQCVDSKKPGYIPKEKWGEGNLCERCFRILHYNDLQVVSFSLNEEILHSVNEKKKYVFFLVDILNISLEVIKKFHEVRCPKCLVVSKMDLLPRSVKEEKICTWLKNVYGIQEKILFLSAIKKRSIHSIEKVMEKEYVKEAYVMGFTNAGKSTLINALLENNKITTSMAPNTTLDFMKLTLENGFVLFDTPGFSYENVMYDEKDVALLKRIHTKKGLKPITFQLKKGVSVVIEECIRLENQSDQCNITIYMSPSLAIKKVYEKNHFLKDEKKVSWRFSSNEDLVVKGFGFVTCKSDALLTIYTKKTMCLEKRKSFFSGE